MRHRTLSRILSSALQGALLVSAGCGVNVSSFDAPVCAAGDFALSVEGLNPAVPVDYLEFRKAVQSIAQMQHLDEPNQFKTAFAAAQAFNVNADTLFDSAKKYLNVLEAEQIQFNKTADQYLQNQLNQKQTESGQLKQTIRNAEETLAQLQAKLDEDKKKLSALESDLSNAQLKVDSNKAAFESAYQQVVRQIKEDLQKMETYLK